MTDEASVAAFIAAPRRVRRPRHPRLERRHRVGVAVDETTLATWQRNIDILATGYFLVAREAFRVLKRQGRGGSIVFVGCKNALVASPGASAYCTAKAAALHLARCLAAKARRSASAPTSSTPTR